MLNAMKVHHIDSKIRLGEQADGGYVIADLSGTYDAYFSCGVSTEESFSRDFIAKYNMKRWNNFAFDGTIQEYPHQYTTEINFIQKNIGPRETDATTNLQSFADKYTNIFLKMDIEGGEYPWLLSTDTSVLRKFKQITIEFHGINDNGWWCPLDYKVLCLEKLATTHYLVHAHGNNHSGQQNGIPDVIELTYVNKNYFTTVPELNRSFFPVPGLDYPNWGGGSDYPLTTYPFVAN
jgi:hypothetical protein